MFGLITNPRYRGWWIVSTATSTQFLTAVLWMQSYGAYVVLLREDFGWSKALMATAFAMSQLLNGLLAPVQGWMLDSLGSRLLVSCGLAAFGFGLIALSQIDSLTDFYMAFMLTAVGISFGGFLTVMPTVVNWFSAHRAKALAITQAGFSLGGLAVPLMVFLLESFGWRTTVLGSGLLVLALILPITLIFQYRPTDKSYIDGGLTRRQASSSSKHSERRADFTARQALRTRAFWLLSIGHGIALLSVSAIGVHLIPHLTESLGYSLSRAGWVVGLMTLCQLSGQVLGMFVGDRFNKSLICTLCMVGHTLALLLIAFADNLPMVIAFAFLHGIAWGLRGPMMVALRADFFGPSSFGKIMGISASVVVVGMALGPILVGALADIYSYRVGFVPVALLVLLGGLCFVAAKPPEAHAKAIRQ